VRRAALALLCAALLLALAPAGVTLPGAGRTARAAEYTLATTAQYDVQPDDRRIVVAVDVTFKNTTPDPGGQFSVFNVVDLAIHSGATSVAASDSRGALRISVAERNGVNVASVSPRTPVRYNQTMTFTLTYLLPDAATPDIRVRPSAVAFPAWSFGTSGAVAIVLPGDYEVRVDGDDLTATQDATAVRLESGPVADPTTWLARVTAVRPASFTTLSEGVALASGTVDLQVRAWTDDEAWGEATMDLLARALPLLEKEIGLEYPRVGPLVVVESVPDLVGDLSEPVADAGAIAVGFNQPPFTTLHQIAHVWLSEQLVGDRWIREGFASQAAAAVATELEVTLPYDPAARTTELGEAAFPLISWGAGEATVEQDAFGYAGSWALAERLAAAVGADALRMAWGRFAAGVGAYEPIAAPPPAPSGRPVTPVDSRRLLDQLEAVSGQDLTAEFTTHVFDEAAAAELPQRTAARQAYVGLLAAAGEWGAPDPVLADLEAWRFDEAQAAIPEATAWLAARDELLAAIDAAGLAAPDRLRERYRASGGGPDARDELEAEAVLVAGYSDVRAQIARQPSVVEQVGLLGGAEPSARLAEASALFAEGDLRGAAEEVDAARARLAGAFSDGAVRLGSAAAVLVVLLLAIVAIRRRRTRGYTARP
jgi:hypothetical protein